MPLSLPSQFETHFRLLEVQILRSMTTPDREKSFKHTAADRECALQLSIGAAASLNSPMAHVHKRMNARKLMAEVRMGDK